MAFAVYMEYRDEPRALESHVRKDIAIFLIK